MKIFLIVSLLIVALLVAVALLGGSQLREKLSALSPEPPSTTVRVEPATTGTLVETVSAPGAIEPHTSVSVAAVVSARVVELSVRSGQEVTKGDLLCKLDDRDLSSTLLSATARRDGEQFRLRSEEASLEGLRTSRRFAQSELERIRALFETGDKSQRDLEAAEERVQDVESSIASSAHAISVTESSLAAAEADIERAQDGLDNTIITAPMDGKITLLNVEVGEIVTGSTTNPGTVLMTIADLSRMIHKAEVAESDVAQLAVGQRAQLHINAYPDEVFNGTVRQIAWQRSGSPDGTGFFETEIEIDLQGRRIRSGLRANADIEIATHEGIIVPRQAIVAREVEELDDEVRTDPLVERDKQHTSVVYRLVDGEAVCTPVRSGASDLTQQVVEEGLEEGALVVIGPYKVLDALKHGERAKRDEADDETDEDADDETSEERVATSVGNGA